MVKHRRTLLLLTFLIGVTVFFWSSSRYPALSDKAAMSGPAGFADPMTHEAHFTIPERAPVHEKVLYTTLNWYETNWRGMLFGLVIAAGFLTLLRYLPRQGSTRRVKNSFMGMLMGTPLGVCVNCVAPIAKGIYEAGSRLETALSVMFSSPTLNIVVLTMVFSIFPFYMALLKVAATLLLILVLVPLLARWHPARVPQAAAAADAVCELEPEIREGWPGAVKGAGADYLKNLRYIVVRTVPLMLLAGFLGALLSHLWSFEKLIGVPVNWINLGLISFMGTFLPLPIAFDVMLAQALMMSGMPAGFVMASLFTFGTFSIYSALIVYKTFSLKLAVQLYAIVFLLGIGLGAIANAYSEHRHVAWLSQFDAVMADADSESAPPEAHREPEASDTPHRTTAIEERAFFTADNVSVSFTPHNARTRSGPLPFTKLLGPKLGIDYWNTLTPENFFDPFYFGRGIASGDVDGDGWTDIAIATDRGFSLYQNIDGAAFKRWRWQLDADIGKEGIHIALVDLDNDGKLDVFLTTFQTGNYAVLNPLSQKAGGRVLKVPNGDVLLTNAAAFADIDGDGYLDIANGNYHLGVLTRKPIENAADQLVRNRNLKFTLDPLAGVPGQTQTVMWSDFLGDRHAELVVGNDYLVPDTYFTGAANGALKKITRRDGLLPVSTENTMSLDTGDFNNDLIPDLYLANIGFSKGIDVVSNIFGKTMREAGREFCDSGAGVLERGECHDMVKLVTLLNPEKQDTSEKCVQLQNRRAVKDCMVTRLALFAAERKDASLCNRIVSGHALGQTLCRQFFLTRPVDTRGDDEIPQRALANVLLKGRGAEGLEDVSEQAGVTTAEWSWNARFLDLDNDEWQDLYVVNGVLITQEFATNNFFHNQKGETFLAAETAFGLEDRDHSSSYTAFDLDRDGDLDIIANTQYGPFKVYLNNDAQGNSVTFKLRDHKGNRFCIGCVVTIHYGPGNGRHQMREIKAGGGFHSTDAPMAHFGLDRFESIGRVEVRWSTGETSVLERPFPANREFTIRRNG